MKIASKKEMNFILVSSINYFKGTSALYSETNDKTRSAHKILEPIFE